jgi:hypothetical protein
MRHPRVSSDRGAGLIGAIGGLMVFLALLSFAVQLLFNLYANSAITAAAHDAAHLAASGAFARSDPAAVAGAVEVAESQARSVLGRYGERVEFHWDIDGERVRLTVSAQHPGLAIRQVSSVFGLNRTERTIEVRVEDMR